MVIVETSEYLNVSNCEVEDLVEIVGEGEHSTIKDRQTQQNKKVLNIPVKLNGDRELIYTPSNKVIKEFATKWGRDTKNWVGKKFQIEIRTIEAFGREMNVIRPKFID